MERRVEGGPDGNIAAGGRGCGQAVEHRLAVLAAAVIARLAEEQVHEHMPPRSGHDSRQRLAAAVEWLAAAGGCEVVELPGSDASSQRRVLVAEPHLRGAGEGPGGDALLVQDLDLGRVGHEVARQQRGDSKQKLLAVERRSLVEQGRHAPDEDRREDDRCPLQNRIGHERRLGRPSAEPAEPRLAAPLEVGPILVVHRREPPPFTRAVASVVPRVLPPAVGRDDVGAEHRAGGLAKQPLAAEDEVGLLDPRVVVDHGDERGAESVAGVGVAHIVAAGEAEVRARLQELDFGHRGDRRSRGLDYLERRAIVDHDNPHRPPAFEPPQRLKTPGRDVKAAKLEHDEAEGGVRVVAQQNSQRVGQVAAVIEGRLDAAGFGQDAAGLDPEPAPGCGQLPHERRVIGEEAVSLAGGFAADKCCDQRPGVLSQLGRIVRQRVGGGGGGDGGRRGRRRSNRPDRRRQAERCGRLVEEGVAVPGVGLEVGALGPLVPGVDEHEPVLGRLLADGAVDRRPQPGAVAGR